MKEKGFTLIELLAVIVILAIIALIATPIILNIINDARKESQERSIELYASAVRNAIAKYQLNNTSAPTSFDQLEIEYDGAIVDCGTKMINSDGSIYLADCKVGDTLVEGYKYGTLEEVSAACTYVDSEDDTGEAVGTIDLSDVVTCGTESFYVMSNENNEVTMLSMYNLNVGDNKYANELTYGIQDEHVLGSQPDTSYGEVYFATESYWTDENDNLLPQYGTTYPVYVYGNYTENLVYPYVNSYETYLKEELKVNSVTATLISYEQFENLKNNLGNPSWLYSAMYWMGSATGIEKIKDVYDFGESDDSVVYVVAGVRPVITISTSEIQ